MIAPNFIVHSQCNPREAESCEETQVLCSLDQLNGYTCRNRSTLPSGCNPLCINGGTPHNTGWWGFVTDGGSLTIAINVINCDDNAGINFGIKQDCTCSTDVACFTNCLRSGTYTFNITVQSCKLYYLWVDGCNGDVCDFTITTSGGAPVKLSKLSPINNDQDGKIGPLCLGTLPYRFSVNPQPNNCEPVYIWSLNGTDLESYDDNIYIEFPDTGVFNLCVSAYIGNPLAGSICNQEGPVCAKIHVVPGQPKYGPIRYLCVEDIPFKWHSNLISSTGLYHESFIDPRQNCTFDSIVEFVVLDKPVREEIFYINCYGFPFVDSFGNVHPGCKNREQIFFNKSTEPFRCDSSILLTAVYPNFTNAFNIRCDSQQLLLTSRIQNQTQICGANESYDYRYSWYEKEDSNKVELGTDDYLMVPAISKNYCLDVFVTVGLSLYKSTCIFTFCESINESEYLPAVKNITGNFELCDHDSLEQNYIAEFHPQANAKGHWSLVHGDILAGQGTSASRVKWNIPKGSQGQLCFNYESDCGYSPALCMKIWYNATYAGPDTSVYFTFKYRMTAFQHSNGIWSKIKGPGTAQFNDFSKPDALLIVNRSGDYIFRWTNHCPNAAVFDDVNISFKSKRDIPGDKKGNESNNGFLNQDLTVRSENLTNYFHISPNPIADRSLYIVRKNVTHPAQLKIFDAKGRLLSFHCMEEGLDEFYWPLNDNFNSGIYFLSCTQGDFHQVLKFIIF